MKTPLNLFQPGFAQITIGRIDRTGTITLASLTLSNHSISRNHGGGDLEISFVIGDNSSNGTAGVITTSSETLTRENFPPCCP